MLRKLPLQLAPVLQLPFYQRRPLLTKKLLSRSPKEGRTWALEGKLAGPCSVFLLSNNSQGKSKLPRSGHRWKCFHQKSKLLTGSRKSQKSLSLVQRRTLLHFSKHSSNKQTPKPQLRRSTKSILSIPKLFLAFRGGESSKLTGIVRSLRLQT